MKNTYTFVNVPVTKEEINRFTKKLEKIVADSFSRQISIQNSANNSNTAMQDSVNVRAGVCA
ncbi:MAG: hypothetical protein IJ666_01260 [Ruminococcus sp.]|nr:hypothetical protein [Ruminococcus sp.]